jgi:hypothetical protein
MGDSHNDPLRVVFDRQIKLEFHGATGHQRRWTLGLSGTRRRPRTDAHRRERSARHRTGQNTQHTLTALLRQSIYRRLAGRPQCAWRAGFGASVEEKRLMGWPQDLSERGREVLGAG